MFIFLLQLRHSLGDHAEIYLFSVFSGVVWALWILKVVLSRRYRPYTGDHSPRTSIIVPVLDEPLELFRDVLRRVTEQNPDEVLVVINGPQNPGLQGVCEEFAPLVRWFHTPIPGKRNAVKIGTEMSRFEITVLLDSDTVWTDGTLSELVKPFADPKVGGVTTRQRILDPTRSWITRWADWLENSRSLYSMPAQSVLGQVGCLPGRTIAFRRHILIHVMDDFMHQQFMGVFLEVSDDRTLTNLTLKQGYRTVYQHTSLVYTDAPLQVKKLFKQQLRWARGSQYNTLRMLPWMLGHAPVLAVFFLADILLPFLLVGTILGWLYRSATGTGTNLYQAILDSYGARTGWLWIFGLMVASSVLSMAIRQIRHLQEVPSDFFRLPVFILTSTFFLMPVRFLGFLRMAHASGWGTRAGAYAGGVSAEQSDAGLTVGGDASTEGPLVPTGLRPRRGVASNLSDGLMAELESLHGSAPLDVVDSTPAPAAGVALRERRTTRTAPAPAAPPQPRRHYNPKAAIPYLIALVLLSLEALLYV